MSRLGVDVSLLVLATPLAYEGASGSHRAWFVSTLLRPGATWRLGKMRGLLAVGAGASVLTGANEDAPFFRDSFEVKGSFWGYVVRPEFSVLYDVSNRATLHVTPLAFDYSPAFEEFTNPEVDHVIRFYFGAGAEFRM